MTCYGGRTVVKFPIEHTLRVSAPATEHPLKSAIIPPETADVSKIKSVTTLIESLYTLSDNSTLAMVYPFMDGWRRGRAFDMFKMLPASDAKEHLRAVLAHARIKLCLCFNIAVDMSSIDMGLLNWIGSDGDLMCAQALHDLGADLKQSIVRLDDSKRPVRSLIASVSDFGHLDFLKKVIEWGAYDDLSIVHIAYSMLHCPAGTASEVVKLLVDECGLDANLNPCVEGNVSREMMELIKIDTHGDPMPLLSFAASVGLAKVCEVLIERGAIVEHVVEEATEQTLILDTPLKTAVCWCMDGQRDPNRHGRADPESRDGMADVNYIATVDVLLRAGASLRMPKTPDRNLLGLAVCSSASNRALGRALVVKLLHAGKPTTEMVEKVLSDANKLIGKVRAVSDNIPLLQAFLKKGSTFCCDVCEKMQGERNCTLKLCACRTISYCGKECQKKAWKQHKKVCGIKDDGSSEALVKKKKKSEEPSAAAVAE
jgi:hypothetical protein